ncbi:MAG: serine protease [Deltaproteobacteria bacterium]|nr:serine protease [Deltaproteobacteria bacterium]
MCENRVNFYGHILIVAVLCLGFVWTPAISPADASPRTAYVIPVSGTVDPGMAAFIARACKTALADPQSIVVLDMDTFGGRVDSALEIVDTLLTVPKERSIAYVSKKAISAGALIALSCGRLVMAPGTTIGDCAPITISREGPKMMGEKFQSPIRAKFRALARRNGYPEALAESMVTLGKVVLRVEMKGGEVKYMDAQEFDDLKKEEKDGVVSKQMVVKEGELLTMDDTEARQLGFSAIGAASVSDMFKQLDMQNITINRIGQSWSETLSRFIGTIIPILMIIGIGALYIEIKSPGFGIFGIIGIAFLSIVFFNQYIVGLATYTEFLILIAGIFLLAAEVFVIPGFGIAGFSGIAMIVVGLILSLQGFTIPDPAKPWEMSLFIGNAAMVLGAYLIAVICGLLFIRFVIPALSTGNRGPVLTATLNAAHADSRETAKVAAGDEGVAVSFLRPSGKADINGERIDVITYNEFIEKGIPVKVAEVNGNRVIVVKKEGV